MADLKLSALTEISVPALEDLLYTVDDPAGTPASAKVSANRLGGLLTRAAFGYRLTTDSGVPVTLTDRASQSTLYLTPDHATPFSRLLSLYDGTRWKLYTNAEISLALSGLTSGKNYDVFVYDNAGTLTLELSAAWTTDTARADALTTQDEIYVKSGATTRRYAGTIRTTGTTTTEDSSTKRFVWNAYNQVPRLLRVYDTTDNWSYTTDSWRQARATATNQVEMVCGLAGSHAALILNQMTSGSSAVAVGVGLDSTTAADETYSTIAMNASGTLQHLGAAAVWQVPLGYHYAAWLERGNAGGTFYGYQAGYRKSGLLGEIYC